MNHGTVRRLTPSNSEYDRILSCIKMYESKYEDYFVRSITIDDKYAFVVLSGRSNAATIREYILRYDNGIWEVVMDDLEAEEGFRSSSIRRFRTSICRCSRRIR